MAVATLAGCHVLGTCSRRSTCWNSRIVINQWIGIIALVLCNEYPWGVNVLEVLIICTSNVAKWWTSHHHQCSQYIQMFKASTCLTSRSLYLDCICTGPFVGLQTITNAIEYLQSQEPWGVYVKLTHPARSPLIILLGGLFVGIDHIVILYSLDVPVFTFRY